jgi:hypothetical protein
VGARGFPATARSSDEIGTMPFEPLSFVSRRPALSRLVDDL